MKFCGIVLAGIWLLVAPKGVVPIHAQAPSRDKIEFLSEPTLFGEGVISTPDSEWAPTFAPDMKTVYFSKSTSWTIVFSRFENGKWITPEVAPFSGVWIDVDPFMSPDGNRLFFSSNRPLSGSQTGKPKDFDIWFVDRTSSGWSEPKNVGAPVNTADNEYFPSVSNKGTLCFHSRRQSGKGLSDVYCSEMINGRYAEPKSLPFNSPLSEQEPFIAPDESFMIFVIVDRPDGYGGPDLYISFNHNGQWSPPQNLGPKINSSFTDGSPWVSPDSKTLFFSSSRRYDTIPRQKPISYAELVNQREGIYNGLLNIFQVSISLPLTSAAANIENGVIIK